MSPAAADRRGGGKGVNIQADERQTQVQANRVGIFGACML